MRRSLSIRTVSGIAALGLAVTLAACGSTDQPSAAPPPTNPVRLSLATAGDEAKAAEMPVSQPEPEPATDAPGDFGDDN